MSDFLTADICDLLNESEAEPQDATEKAYKLLLERDRELMREFSVTGADRLTWPEPVRKRHIR
jgi:hypothetical protein